MDCREPIHFEETAQELNQLLSKETEFRNSDANASRNATQENKKKKVVNGKINFTLINGRSAART